MTSLIACNVVTFLARLWQGNDELTAYGNAENETLLAVAYKAVYLDEALVGVTGTEFLYDKLAQKMKQLGCSPDVGYWLH